MAIISLGKIDKKLIPILVGCIFCFSNRLLNNYEGTILFKHIIITNIIIAISKLFTLIPFILYKLNSKAVYSYEIQNNNSLEQFYKINKQKIIKGKWWYNLLSSIIHFVQATLFIYTISIRTNYWILTLLFEALLYYLIFKIKLYKHHYLSIIICILIGLAIDLILEYIKNDLKNNLLFVLFRIIREILFSLHDVLNKYIIEKKYCFIYEISLFNGITNTFFFMIFVIFDYFFFKLDDYGEYFRNFNGSELLIIFGVIITQLGIYLAAIITNKNNTPCHVFIILVFGQLAHYIDFSSKSIVAFICFIFILIMSLIFNEIIELNFCGLSDNIKRNIINRAEKENFNIEKNFLIDTSDENYVLYSAQFGKNDNDTEDIKSESLN